MRNDSLDNLLFLVRLNRIDVARAVQLRLTATIALAPVEHLVDVRGLRTALVLVEACRAADAASSLHFGRLRVVTTVAHLGNGVVLLTTVAPDQVEVGPDLPVDFLPADAECLPDEGYELLKVPVPVDDVFSAHLSVSVDALLAVSACEDLALLF